VKVRVAFAGEGKHKTHQVKDPNESYIIELNDEDEKQNNTDIRNGR